MRLGWAMAGDRQRRCAGNCFNEAEARAPRMGRVGSDGPALPLSFNEAEARAPRMADRPGRYGRRASASMRPRRVRLGWILTCFALPVNSLAASMRPRRVRLGWDGKVKFPNRRARRFNEAEARAPRMGRQGYRGEYFQHAGASMRPRRVRLGWRFFRTNVLGRIHKLQ